MSVMTRKYRILFLDHSQIVTREERIDARDDGAAVDQAGNLAGSQGAEVWEGLRQVARLPQNRTGPMRPHSYNC
jgi:hypothetical protein